MHRNGIGKKGFVQESLALTLTIFLLLTAGCDETQISFIPGDGDATGDGDAAGDEDASADGDISTDGDQSADGDQPADGDLSADGDGENDIDGKLPGIHAELTNRGDQAAYTNRIFQEESQRAFRILDENHQVLPLRPFCVPQCGEECLEVLCKPSTPEVRQILPGESIEFFWDGLLYEPVGCMTEGYGKLPCYERRAAAAGQYYLQFCFSTLIETDAISDPQRKPEDIIENVWMADPRCVEYPIELEAGVHQLQADFEASMGEEKKTWRYCGPGWTFSPAPAFEILAGQLNAIEGNSVVIPVQLNEESFSGACWRNASMEHYVNESEMEITLHGGIYYSESFCEVSMEDRIFGHMLGQLKPGTWTAQTQSPITPEADVLVFEVHPCPDCLDCGDMPSAGLNEACTSDCQCIDEAAVCNFNCQRHCASNSDCPAGTHCRYDDSIAAVTPPKCLPQLENECASHRDCRKGFDCLADDSGWRRCLPDVDTRIIADQYGQGIHCACDVECPGVQSCIRFEFNFTDGFCALRCRNEADCPTDWQCLGLTQSGLQAICIPPY